jgi:RHS repeat-associated protein
MGALTQVLVENDTNNSPVAYYVYGLGLAERITPDGTVVTYHYNIQGSTVALTDSGGDITDSYAYDSFGVLANSDGVSPQPFRYLGRYGILDDRTGLLYARARYWNPQLGRFLTKDPVTGKDGDSQSLNRYLYTLNNPLRFVDPSGMFSGETFGSSVGQFLAGGGELIGGIPISIYLGTQASIRSRSILPLLGASVGAFDTVNDASKQLLASAVNFGGAFYDQPPLSEEDTIGVLDNVLNAQGVRQIVAANKIYSLVNSINNIRGIVKNSQETERFLNQLKSIISDKGKFSFRISGVGSLDDIKEVFKTFVNPRDLAEALNSLFGQNQFAANTPVLVEVIETRNVQPNACKK